ncbi:mogroside IE synthase-like [Fagus crenata]
MLQFSKRLASKGPRVTLLTTTSISESMQAISSHSVNIETISDCSAENNTFDNTDSDQFESFKMTVTQSLTKFIETQNSSQQNFSSMMQLCHGL